MIILGLAVESSESWNRLVQRKPSDGDLGFRFLVTSFISGVKYGLQPFPVEAA